MTGPGRHRAPEPDTVLRRLRPDWRELIAIPERVWTQLWERFR